MVDINPNKMIRVKYVDTLGVTTEESISLGALKTWVVEELDTKVETVENALGDTSKSPETVYDNLDTILKAPFVNGKFPLLGDKILVNSLGTGTFGSGEEYEITLIRVEGSDLAAYPEAFTLTVGQPEEYIDEIGIEIDLVNKEINVIPETEDAEGYAIVTTAAELVAAINAAAPTILFAALGAEVVGTTVIDTASAIIAASEAAIEMEEGMALYDSVASKIYVAAKDKSIGTNATMNSWQIIGLVAEGS